jgi:hypothetical protein
MSRLRDGKSRRKSVLPSKPTALQNVLLSPASREVGSGHKLKSSDRAEHYRLALKTRHLRVNEHTPKSVNRPRQDRPGM